MSFNGSGTFVINTAGQPVVANTVISATVFNALTADLATGLSTCITKDGQTTITANIPFGSNKITGLGAATAATDAATFGQVQSTAAKLITVTGTDTITGTMSPALTAYAAGQLFYFIANAANTGAMTINIDGLGAKAITRDGSTALIAGDVNTGEIVVICYDGTRFQMINAANSFGNTTINGTLTVTGNTGLQANVSITSTLSVGGTFAVTGAATLGSTLSVTGKSDLPVVSTASMNAAVAVITTGTVTNLTSTSASIASMNAGVALLTNATVTTLTATGASIASANIGNLQFTAASIASINAGVAVITNLTAIGASIASANVGTAVITAATVTGASIASMNAGVALLTTATVTNLTATGASIASANVGTLALTRLDVTAASVASANAGVAVITSLTATGASIASMNAGVALLTTATMTSLTATGASIASANVGTAVITGLTVTNASIASANAGTATLSGNLTLNGGTANGVLYLNGSKVATSGTGFVFDGTNVGVGTSSPTNVGGYKSISVNGTDGSLIDSFYNGTLTGRVQAYSGGYFVSSQGASVPLIFGQNNTESMRLTSTGLGIGTSSPSGFLANKLVIATGGTANEGMTIYSSSNNGSIWFADATTGTGRYAGGLDYTHSDDTLIFYSAAQGNMRLNASGNLGLGVTPSAWGLGKALEVAFIGNSLWSPGGNETIITNNAYYDSAWKYARSAEASYYDSTAGKHIWFNAPSGTAGNAITFTQAMTLDASGNLLVGATSAASTERLNVVGGIGIRINEDGSGTKVLSLRSDFAGAGPAVNVPTNHPLLFQTNNTERARITSGGNFLIGNTSALDSRLIVLGSGTSSTGYSCVFSDGNGADLFWARNDGLINTGTRTNSPYNYVVGGTNRDLFVDNSGNLGYVSSIRESKTNITPVSDVSWLMQLNPVTFNFRKKDEEGNYTDQADGPIKHGLIAEEVEAVNADLCFYDDAENGGKLRGVNYTHLITPMLKLLQEQQAMINDLKAKVAALKGA